MPITHEQYAAEQAAGAERYAKLMAEAQAEYDRWWIALGEATIASDGVTGKQKRRRANQPVSTHAPKAPCTRCGQRLAFAKGMCRPCYMASRNQVCACGCGKHAQVDGYAKSCYARRAREVLEAAQGLEPYDGPRCTCGARLEGAVNPNTGEPYKRCTDCLAEMARARSRRGERGRQAA